MDEIESAISEAVQDAGDIGVQDTPAGETTSQGTEQGTSGDPGQTQQAQAQAVADMHEELDVPLKRNDGRENRVPISRAESMAQKRVQKQLAAIAKAMALDTPEGDLKAEALIEQITNRGTELTTLQGFRKHMDSVEQLIKTDDETFMRKLAENNPRYQRYLKVLEQGGSEAQAQAAQAADAEFTEPEPSPDIDLGNGKFTWSKEGLAKRDAWQDRKYEHRFQKMLNEKFKPIEDKEAKAKKDAEDRERAEGLREQARQRLTRKLERAGKWPEFEKHQPAIEEILTKDTDGEMDLAEAYIQHVLPLLAADRTKMRAELLDELKAAPSKTSEGVADKGQQAAPVDDSYEALIKASIAGLRR